MKSLYLSLICILTLASCKSDKNTTAEKEDTRELTIAEKIANAHGFKNWENVDKVEFTFKVDRDTIKGKGRSWTWMPKSNSITMQAGKEKIKYIQSEMDSVALNIDRAFINDKYWLFAPFQLVWDESATISEPKISEAPISKTKMNMITITYPNEGGYTPGDAYDIFYNTEFLIEEWIFRKGNAIEPSMATTFENYKDYNGIKIATEHKMAGGNWNLNFTNIKISVQ